MLVLFYFYFISIIFLKIYNTFFKIKKHSDYIYNDKNNYKTNVNDVNFEYYFCRLFMV